jgi:hypothetical protein
VNNPLACGFVLFLFALCIPSSLIAQDKQSPDSLVSTAQLPRTSMFPQKTLAINQSFHHFFNGHNPKTATYLGFVPGLGQIYNKKYWKLPIVYAGFGVIGYFAFSNRNEYKKFADAYHCKLAEDPDDPETKCEDPLAQKYTLDNLKANRDYYRRNMELSFVIMGVWYILQILDATVDAHLYGWEVDEDLSVRVQPVFNPQVLIPSRTPAIPANQPAVNGISVTFSF